VSGARSGLRLAAALAAAFLALAGGIRAAWIPVKAELAQWLIERSWQRELAGEPQPPWPWADTRAAALLTVPRLQERLVVLDGQSGRNLAFGPVLLAGSRPGGDTVISGHRDTHFRFLQDLQAGDRLQLSARQFSDWYEVREIDVVDSRGQELVLEPGVDRVSLVTCYPFDSPLAGGPLRYVVTAYPAEVPPAAPVSRRSPASG
jgi:sortase A